MDLKGTGGGNSCVETPAAPEWLSQLENRREKLKRAKLGHEAGAGAPCSECGDKCPGLDLHFWRKVCRNCKCRKDQHMCKDDDLSGWAQFEILGQIRSKPAYIKIKALASEPVRLDWVPPNAAADVVSDYMEKLGTKQIPIEGSDAALKRKQQLEFQVPPHDLDASLCDNLTEAETQQLQQYVQKIRDNCVGQGNVIRIGNPAQAFIGHMPQMKELSDLEILNPEQLKILKAIGEEPVTADSLLHDLLSSEKLNKAIVSQAKEAYPKMFIVYSEPITDSMAEFEHEPALSNPSKEKLCGLNQKSVQSLVHHGPIYDKILTILKAKNLDVSRDPKLGPIADFRKEYLTNPQFAHEVNSVTPLKESPKPQYTTPLKTPRGDLSFHSPIPLKNPIKTRFSAQMKQDTPMRKVTFGNVSTTIYDCGLPTHIDYSKDPVFSAIINADPLKQAVKEPSSHQYHYKQPLVLALTPLTPDYYDDPLLSPTVKRKLSDMNVDTKAIQSAVLNGPFYDQLFRALEDKGVDYEKCQLLQPLADVRQQIVSDKPFAEELKAFVAQIPSSFDIAFGSPQQASLKAAALSNSHSNDSGFDSKASTPSHGSTDELNAAPGRFMSVPGIEDMNMYPQVASAYHVEHLPQAMNNLHVANDETISYGPESGGVVLNCRDCNVPIGFGEVAVKAERAGKEIAWHPACFKCHTCRELLADLVYFFHGGQVYCGRDLAIKLKIPRCKACDELIFTKEYTAAEGSTFHIKHFCCFQCDVPLAGQQYIPDEKTNMPLCLKCYDDYYAASCQSCKRPIGPADQGVAWQDIHWHGECFNCAGVNCSKSLIGGRFCVKQNMPFCSPACVRSIIV